MSNDVGRARASMVMDALRAVFGIGWAPELYEPGFHHDEAWVIASETGPEGWTSMASTLVNPVPGNGVYVEAINHWSVAVFPDNDSPAEDSIVLAGPEHWSDVAVEHERTEGPGQIRMRSHGEERFQPPRKLGL